jgi:hypothetical protein
MVPPMAIKWFGHFQLAEGRLIPIPIRFKLILSYTDSFIPCFVSKPPKLSKTDKHENVPCYYATSV